VLTGVQVLVTRTPVTALSVRDKKEHVCLIGLSKLGVTYCDDMERVND
jgi:hypothetical protein